MKNVEHLPCTNKVNQVSYVYGSNRESANQITNHSNYVYDANGSVLSSSKLNKTLLMDYDIRSNLVSSIAVNNQYIIDYDYDASGERVYSGMGSSSKIYINSITSNPLTIIDSNDNVTHYIYGPKGIVAKRNESLTYFLLKDHLESTRVIMNENNQAISSYDYDAWGNPMNSTVSEESAYRFTGREYDEETGLHNFRARLYDSTLMRFYQVDPAEQFASPYVYCGNNPISVYDPNGKEALKARNYARPNLFDLKYAPGFDYNNTPTRWINPDVLVCNEFCYQAMFAGEGISDFPLTMAEQKEWFKGRNAYYTDINDAKSHIGLGDILYFGPEVFGQRHEVMVWDIKRDKSGNPLIQIMGARNSKLTSGIVDIRYLSIEEYARWYKGFAGLGSLPPKEPPKETSVELPQFDIPSRYDAYRPEFERYEPGWFGVPGRTGWCPIAW